MKTITIIMATLLLAGNICASCLEDNLVYQYHNARIVRGHKLERGSLWVLNGKVVTEQEKADRSVDMGNRILAPGYIDIQINGGFGVDFSTHPEDWKKVAKQLPKHGVTSFLATLVSMDKESYAKAIPILKPRTKKGCKGPKKCATLLGVHLEGPFLNKEKRGAHNEGLIMSDLKGETLEQFYGSLKGVRIITVAPENPCMTRERVQELRDKRIIMAAGHTQMTYAQTRKAMLGGIKLTTHLFNAMTPFQHREPGVIGAVLERPLRRQDVSYFSIIADYIHVHRAAVSMAFNSNRRGLILVTDAMQALGYKDGEYKLGFMDVTVLEGSATITGTNTLAGSVLTMEEAVQNLQDMTKCSIVQAIEAATYKPAKLLGITQQRGTLNVGNNADFIVLDRDLNVLKTYIGNELVYSKEGA